VPVAGEYEWASRGERRLVSTDNRKQKSSMYTTSRAWRSPGDADRKLGGVELAGNEAGFLLPRRERKVVPVSVHIEDNGLCTDDDDEVDKDAVNSNVDHVKPVQNCSAGHGVFYRPRSSSTSSSSTSGDLRGYDDTNLKTSVYDLPPELGGSATSVPLSSRPRSSSTADVRHHMRAETLASDALSAVVRSCGSLRKQSSRKDDVAVGSPAVFVVSDNKQMVVFTVDRASRCSRVTPAVHVSHSDHTINRSAIYTGWPKKCKPLLRIIIKSF